MLQHDRFNSTALATAVVVAITSQLKYAELPGNVRLRKGEAGLPRSSVVNVTQMATVDRDLLGPRLGALIADPLWHRLWSLESAKETLWPRLRTSSTLHSRAGEI